MNRYFNIKYLPITHKYDFVIGTFTIYFINFKLKLKMQCHHLLTTIKELNRTKYRN